MCIGPFSYGVPETVASLDVARPPRHYHLPFSPLHPLMKASSLLYCPAYPPSCLLHFCIPLEEPERPVVFIFAFVKIQSTITSMVKSSNWILFAIHELQHLL